MLLFEKLFFGVLKMKNEKYELVLNSQNYVVCANSIVRGKQAMSRQTAKLIRLTVMQVAQHDEELKTYHCRITDLAEFLDISPDNLYRDIVSICEEAMKSVVYIGTQNPKCPWEMIHWISSAKYDGNGNLTIRLSDELKPFVLELDKWFTRYRFKSILEFNSFYAIRLYELIICELGTHKKINKTEFSIFELRQCFGCEKKLKKNNDFIRKTIEVAMKEINEKSDIGILAEYKKTGREITDVVFTVAPKKKAVSLTDAEYDDKDGISEEIMHLLYEVTESEFNEEQLRQLYKTVLLFVHPKGAIPYIESKYAKLARYSRKNKIANRFSYLLKMIENNSDEEHLKPEVKKKEGYPAAYSIEEYEKTDFISEYLDEQE